MISSIEMVVSICVMAVAAAVFIPAYITYVQQARVLALVLPRLQQLETNIALFYFFEKRLPSTGDLAELVEGIDSENLKVELVTGSENQPFRIGNNKFTHPFGNFPDGN